MNQDPYQPQGSDLQLSVPVSGQIPGRPQQAQVVGAMYVGYAMFMVLRMVPAVAGTSITGDASLDVGVGDWGRILAMGTIGAVVGKFIGGYAADRFGGRVTFSVGLLVSAVGVAAFAASSQVWMFQAALFVALMAKSAGWPSMAKIIVTTFRPAEYGRVWGVLATSSRVGTLLATFCLGGLLGVLSWQSMLYLSAVGGVLLAFAFFVTIEMATRRRGAVGPVLVAADESQTVKDAGVTPHPLDGLTLIQAVQVFVRSFQFWMICGSLMGLTIMWDFLLMVPQYLRDTLGMAADDASMASSAFPFGSLISVLVGGFVFDKLNRRSTAWLMGALLTVAAGCILTFYLMPGFGLSQPSMKYLSLALLFVFGLCVSPCYYIPMSVYSIEFGGPHSGFLISLLDAIGFGATALFYGLAGDLAEQSWGLFLKILLAVAAWSMLTTLLFMLGEARSDEKKSAVQAE
ncbi:MAG: MFS transporter [Fuerstiella sp.]